MTTTQSVGSRFPANPWVKRSTTRISTPPERPSVERVKITINYLISCLKTLGKPQSDPAFSPDRLYIEIMAEGLKHVERFVEEKAIRIESSGKDTSDLYLEVTCELKEGIPQNTDIMSEIAESVMGLSRGAFNSRDLKNDKKLTEISVSVGPGTSLNLVEIGVCFEGALVKGG